MYVFRSCVLVPARVPTELICPRPCVEMSECVGGLRFACILAKEVVKQTAGRLVSLLDLFCLASWSFVWSVPSLEPVSPLADALCYLRFLSVNIAVSFRNSTGIWPDVIVALTHLVSAVVLSDAFVDDSVYCVTLAIIAAEFSLVFFSADRRRQRKLWTHNATFRISQLTRNPVQRSIRRSLLLPLVNRRDGSQDESEDVNVVKIHERISSSFLDITPEVSGHNPEKRILHVHCLHSNNATTAKTTAVFLHQFGSGAFTWQAVMADLADSNKLNVVAFDRTAHGLTFASPPLLESREASVHTTPLNDEVVPTVNFSDAVNAPNFEVDLIDQVLVSLNLGQGSVFLIASGGAGAAIAMQYVASSLKRSAVRGIVLVSPYDLATDGIPSVLKSVSTAQVGRALVVSMAKSEVADVLVRRSWESKRIPSSITDAYKNSVETPGWEDAMLNLLKRPVGVTSSAPIETPVMVVAGACDHFIESVDEYQRFAEKLPNGRLEVIPKVGSSPQEERPKEVARLIRAFIARQVHP